VSQRRPYAARLSVPARREQLLDAALEILCRDGYGALSVESIARESGVTRPVVYNVFEGLDDLLGALLDRQEQRAVTALLAVLAELPPPTDVRRYLTRTIKGLAALVADDPRTWAPIFLVGPDTPDAVRERVATARELVRTRFALLLAAVAPARADVGILSHALVAMGEYFARLLLSDPDAVDTDRLAETITAMLTG
jgi:AcrR family transcriptional regulator